MGSPNLGQMTRPSDSQQKIERICRKVDFAVSVDYRVKQKESEKRNEYLDFAWELQNYTT